MRLGAVAVIIATVCGGCVRHEGTYLTLQNAPGGHIAFDQVDFYVGTSGGNSVPTSPLHQTPVARTTVEARFARTLVAPDQWTDPGGSHTSYNYYLPDSTANAMVGAYVMVVVSLNGTPVGIGELQDFVVTSSDVDQYPIVLEPWSPDAEQWGGPNKNDCARWQRSRPGDPAAVPSTLAVVTAGDRDCDGLMDTQDCNPLAYCDATYTAGCASTTPCFMTDTNTCGVGTCTNDLSSLTMTCGGDETCVDPAACSPACVAETGFDARAQCGLQVAMTDKNGASVIPLNPDGTLCSQSTYDLSPFVTTCPNATIVSPPNGVASDKFTFTLSEPTTGMCQLTISPPAGAPNTPFGAQYDLLIFVDDPTGPPGYQRLSYGLTVSGDHNVAGACSTYPASTVTGTPGHCPAT